MKITAIFVSFVMLLVCPCLADESIYTWTDKNGIKRFSDRLPVEVKHYDTIRIPADGAEYGEQAEGSRQEYDRMIKDIRQETQQIKQEHIQGEADRAAEKKRDADASQKERVEAERKQLQEKVDTLKKRPTGRTYSQSLKNAQIKEIEKQLDKLKNSPDEYFQNR